MKRAMWCMALVAVVGLVGFAQPAWVPGNTIPTGVNPVQVFSSFTIPGSFVMWSTGDLDFAGGELTNVTAPGYIGWAKTNTLTVYGLSNQNINVTGEAWAYKLDNTQCPKMLPTRLTGLAYVWSGSAWVAPPSPLPGGGTYDIPLPAGYRTASQVLPLCAAGYYAGEMYLEVYRDGYNDPAGAYKAEIKITITGL